MASAILTLQGGAIFPPSNAAQQPQGNLINFLKDVNGKLSQLLVASGNMNGCTLSLYGNLKYPGKDEQNWDLLLFSLSFILFLKCRSRLGTGIIPHFSKKLLH